MTESIDRTLEALYGDPEPLEAILEPEAAPAAAQPKPASAARIVDMSVALRTAGEPLPYRVGPLAIDGLMTLLIGRRGEHKSWLAQFACNGVHQDQPVGPLAQRKGNALYIDAENGERLMARRFLITGMDAEAFVYADGIGLHLPEHIGEVRGLARHVNAKLIVCDSLRRLAPGMKENDSDSAAPVVASLAQLARDLSVAVVAIHHRSIKPGAPNSRGSSALEDQADICWQLEKVGGDPEGRHRRRLRCTKMRPDEEPPPFWLSFKKLAGFMTIAEAEPYEGGTQDLDRDGESPELAHEVMAERLRSVTALVSADGGWPPSRLAAVCGVDQQSQTFKKALRSLVNGGGWTAEGSTRNRLCKPAQISGHSGQSLKESARKPELELPLDNEIDGRDEGLA
jgi:hypothetical protein